MHHLYSHLSAQIRTELGSWRGAVWLLLLWIAFTVTFVDVSFSDGRFVEQFINEFFLGHFPPPLPETVARFTLPIALLAAALHWLTTRPASPRTRWAAAALVLLLAAEAYWLPTHFLFLPRLLGAKIPEAVDRLVPVVWPGLVLGIILVLIAAYRPRPFALPWQIFIAGSVTGMAAVLLLAYPAFTLVSHTVYSGLIHFLTLFVTGLTGLLVLLAGGPLAVRWSRVPGQAQLTVGTLAGAVGGGYVFAGLGGPFAGLLAQPNLFGASENWVGISPIERVLRHLIDLNVSFPATYAIFWLLLGGGALMGGLIPALWRWLDRTSTHSTLRLVTRPILWPLAVLVVTLILFVVTLANVALHLLFNQTMQDVFDLYGYRPAWSPLWTTFAAGLQPWGALMLAQGLGLLWLYQAPASLTTRRPVIGLAFVHGLFNLVVLPLLLYAMNQSYVSQFWSATALAALMILGLELLGFAWARWREAGVKSATSPDRFAWVTAGAVGAAGAAFLAHLSLATLINPLFTLLVMGKSAAGEKTPPLQLESLEQIISTLPATHFAVFLTTLLWLVAGGVSLSLCLRLVFGVWHWGGKIGFVPATQGCLAWLLTVLAAGIIMVILALTRRSWPLPYASALIGGILLTLLLAYVTLLVLLLARQRFIWAMVLLGVSLALIAAIEYGRGQFVVTPYGLIFIGGLMLSQRRWVERLPQPGCAAFLVNFGRIVLVFLVGYALGGVWLVLYLVAALVLLGMARRRVITRMSWGELAVAFAVTLVGLIGLSLGGSYRLPLDDLGLWLAYMAFLSLAAVVTYRALMIYAPVSLRLTALLVVPLLVWLIGYFSQTEYVVQGGVSRYHPQTYYWEQLSLENSPVAGPLNYQFLADPQGHLWLGAATGLLGDFKAEQWQLHLIDSAQMIWNNRPEPRPLLMADRLLMRPDHQGRLWLASRGIFGRFDPGQLKDNFRGILGREKRGGFSPPPGFSLTDFPITALTFDPAGHLWLATDGTGIFRLTNGDLEAARWETFTAQSGHLPSNKVQVVYADQGGQVWIGTVHGLSRFDGTTWQVIPISGLTANASIIALLEDTRGQLWVGTAGKVYRWNGQNWTTFEAATGWPPDNTGVEILFEDSRGGIWAGTAGRALRFDGKSWHNLVTGLQVTTFAEGPPGVVWIGGQQGLIRYDLAAQSRLFFTAGSGLLAANWVRDLHVDEEGRVWVSTFTTASRSGSPWIIIVMSSLFFGYLFLKTYQGYIQPKPPYFPLSVGD